MPQSVPAQPLVLIIDDDVWIRSVMAETLVAEGYAVAGATNGQAGLELAEQLQPAVIVLDLALPGRSGLEVLQELKHRRPTHEIPVLVVSAYAMLLLGKDARHADGVIQKPFDLAELLAGVEHAANNGRRPPLASNGSAEVPSQPQTTAPRVTTDPTIIREDAG
jgi:two-component system response regulator (stage 0 sporulation protein F)